MGAATDKYRVQLDFTPEAFRELEKLKAEVGASSRADTLRRAMRVLRWTINTLQDGAQILVRRNGALSEIEFPFLSHAEPAEPATRDEQRKQAAEGRIYVQERAREARQQAIERADRGRDVVNQQKEQFRAAYEAGRQAYREATPESYEEKDKQKE